MSINRCHSGTMAIQYILCMLADAKIRICLDCCDYWDISSQSVHGLIIYIFNAITLRMPWNVIISAVPFRNLLTIPALSPDGC